MSSIRFQIASDLHIEREYPRLCSWEEYLTKSSDILILNGDIGHIYLFEQFKYFIQGVCSVWENVYFIPGNHEFYNENRISYKYLLFTLKNLEIIFTNFKVLYNEHVDFEGNIRLYGATLWSHIPEYCRERNIPIYTKSGRLIDASWLNKEYFKAVYDIDKEILDAKDKGKRLIISTHYAPTMNGTLKDYHKIDLTHHYYVSNLERLLKKDCVYVWIFGHTHVNCDYINDRDTRIVSNQFRGSGYYKNKVLRIKHI